MNMKGCAVFLYANQGGFINEIIVSNLIFQVTRKQLHEEPILIKKHVEAFTN